MCNNSVGEGKKFRQVSKFPRCFWGLAYLAGREFSHYSYLRALRALCFLAFNFGYGNLGKGTDLAGFMGFEIGLLALLFRRAPCRYGWFLMDNASAG